MIMEVIDTEYSRWLPPLVPLRPAPPRRAQNTNNTGPRARRRKAYTHTQRSFQEHCARDVLSGLWKDESSPVPLAQQEQYWRGIFQVPSKDDERHPLPKGPVMWSVLAPITILDVTNAIKGMTDGAP